MPIYDGLGANRLAVKACRRQALLLPEPAAKNWPSRLKNGHHYLVKDLHQLRICRQQ
jgi:hypothetical protein